MRTSQFKARDFLSDLKIPNNTCAIVKFCFPKTGSVKQLKFCQKLLVRWHEIKSVMFNIVVYITVLIQVCVKFVHLVEISISGEISMIYFELEIL